MNAVAALSLAAALAIGATTAAQAWVLPEPYDAAIVHRAPSRMASADVRYDPHAHLGCVGLAAGTAHHRCGSATGGPAGGLH